MRAEEVQGALGMDGLFGLYACSFTAASQASTISRALVHARVCVRVRVFVG